jgi:hypothetical protein
LGQKFWYMGKDSGNGQLRKNQFVGSLKLISFRSVHRVKWTGQFDNVLPWWCGVGSMAMWTWQHGLDNWALWTLWCGKVDLIIGHYGLCDVAKWTCQHGLGNWALGTLWFGKVDLAPWTWQLGALDFVIWLSELGKWVFHTYVFVFYIHECFRNL